MKKVFVRSRALLVALVFSSLQIFGLLTFLLPVKADAAGTITTNPATNITDKTATLNGTILGTTNATSRGYEYGKTESFGSFISDPEVNFNLQFGRYNDETGSFDSANAVAIGPDSNLYIANYGNGRVQKFTSSGNFISELVNDESDGGNFIMPSGIAINTSGDVYIADTGNNRIQKFDNNGTFIEMWGNQGSSNGQFNSPHGIAIDSNGDVYVADSDNNRIQKFDSDGNFITKWGSNGTGDGQFNSPWKIEIDSLDDVVYVADSDNSRIQKFDSDGNFITKWGSNGTGDGQFKYISGIAIDSSHNVFVSDIVNNRIQKFDSDGNFILKWGSNGTSDIQFNYISEIAIDANDDIYAVDTNNFRIKKFDSTGTYITKWGRDRNEIPGGQFDSPSGIVKGTNNNIFVVDSGNSRIQKFDSDGNFIMNWGTYGSNDGQFSYPQSIAIDSSGNVYVVDTNNDRIQKFDSDGNFITKWGSNGTNDGEFKYPKGISIDSNNNVYVSNSYYNPNIQKFDSDGNFIAKWGSAGTSNSEFQGDLWVTVSESGYVYISEQGNNRIQKFDSNGNFIAKWGSQGSGAGQLDYPSGIGIDSGGNIYVADSGNERIQKFDSNGNFIAKWGSQGSGAGQFNSPRSIAISSDGYIYITDIINHRIQKFSQNIYPNESYSLSLDKLSCGTTYYYRAFTYEVSTKIYGSTQSFTTNNVCTGPDLKLSIALDQPGLIEGQSGSYTVIFKNVGTTPQSSFINTLFTLPANVELGDFSSIPGVLDAGCDGPIDGLCTFFVYDTARWDGLSDPLDATKIEPGEMFSVTIPVTVKGPVDSTSKIRALALDYFAINMGDGEIDSIDIYELLNTFLDNNPDNINVMFNLPFNNIASYTGIIPGNSDSEEGGTSSDSDPIPDSVEDAAPGNGDGNNDGTPDSQQSNVTSLPNASGDYITLAVPEGVVIDTTTIAQASTLSTKDIAYNYPLGLVSFTATTNVGATIPIELYFYTNQQASSFTPRKYNATTNTYTTLSTLTQTSLTQTTINNQPVLKLSYQLQDGGPLDQDNTANGTIVDPVGLAQATVGVPNTGLGGVQ